MGFGEARHSTLHCPTETVDALPGIADDNDTAVRSKSIQESMVDRVEVLRFINHDKRKPRICSAKARGHVNLIVKVNVPCVGGGDGSGEDDVDEVGGEVVGVFVEFSI